MNKTGDDLRDIFLINGVKVGIETQGDPGSRLATSMKLFVEHDCEVIICATRSRGGTTKLVENLKPKYYISWRGQSVVSDASLRSQSNSSIANLVFEECEIAINV